MNRFLPSLLTISVALGLGALIGALFRRYAQDQRTLVRWRVHVQRLCLLLLNPIASIGAVWILPLRHSGLLFVPAVGVFNLAFGLLVGCLAMALKPLPSAGQRIGFRLSCSITNIGSIGGLIVFVLLGEPAFALVPLYKLFEEYWYYGVLFPYARQQAIKAGLLPNTGQPTGLLRRLFSDPFFVMAVLSIALGLSLDLSGLERPGIFAEINSWLIPANSFLLLLATGTQISVRHLPTHWRPALTVSLLRLALVPACTLSFALLLGFAAGDPMTIKTIVILSMMPIGFTSLVAASLFNFDSDFISAAWIVSNASLLLSLPLLSLMLT